MVVVCPVCREVVHTFSGVIVSHGSSRHGVFDVCFGSGSSLMSCSDCSD